MRLEAAQAISSVANRRFVGQAVGNGSSCLATTASDK